MADTEGANLLPVGTPAPDFTLMDADGNPVTLSEYRGRMNVCLYFYPEGDVPRGSAADSTRFIGADVERFGINPGGVDGIAAAARSHAPGFPLLLDLDREVARRYGAAASGDGRVSRAVYLIDKKGRVAYASSGDPPAEEILKALES